MNETAQIRSSPKPVCTSTTADVCIQGYSVLEDFVSEEEETQLLDYFNEKSLEWLDASIGRRQQHYGFKFNYYTRMIDFLNSVPKIPQNCDNIIQKLEHIVQNEQTLSSSQVKYKFNQLTVNEYYPGQGIGHHIDTINCIGPYLCSLSLGSQCVMTLTKTKTAKSKDIENSASDNSEDGSNSTADKKYIFLPRRSVLILTGESRYACTHGISYRKCDMHNGILMHRERRVSLTFRQVVLPGTIPTSSLAATNMEKQHVFNVYDSIAIHWHHTRGKRKVFWARVKEFLESLEPGSMIADVGCGDGKYFGVTNENNLVMIGCDRSLGLLQALRDSEVETNQAIANGTSENGQIPTQNQTFCCDAVQLPLVTNMFDATLCIAVLHHIGK